MHRPRSLTFENWIPPLEFWNPADRPTWKRLLLDAEEFCNYLDQIDWHRRPLILHTCELCGQPGCGRGDLCALVRLSNAVVFMPWDRPDGSGTPAEDDSYQDRLADDILLSREQWEEIRRHAAGAPEWEIIPAISGLQVFSLWLKNAPPALRLTHQDDLSRRLARHFLAAESMAGEEAKESLRSMETRLSQTDRSRSVWTAIDLRTGSHALETLWFEQPESDQLVGWPVWLRNEPGSLVVSPDVAFRLEGWDSGSSIANSTEAV